MTVQYVIPAVKRESSSKGAARQLRNEGKIPGVIYGAGKEATPITMTKRDIHMSMQEGGFTNNVHTVELDGKKIQVLPREIQRHPVNGMVWHIDFLRVDPKRKLHVMVPVHVIDEEKSPGVKIGGLVSMLRDEVEVICRADQIPEYLEISVEGLAIGESAHASRIKLPEGVEFAIHDRDFTVVNILSTRTSNKADDEAEGAETAEASA